MNNDYYKLMPHQVPEPSVQGSWADVLRWCIAVMDGNDPDLPFIASLLPHALRHGRISVRHLTDAGPIVQRLWADHAAGRLACQLHSVPFNGIEPNSAVAGNA